MPLDAPATALGAIPLPFSLQRAVKRARTVSGVVYVLPEPSLCGAAETARASVRPPRASLCVSFSGRTL